MQFALNIAISHSWLGCRTRNGGFWEFCSSNLEGSIFFPFSNFLSLVSFFRLSVRFRFKTVFDRSS